MATIDSLLERRPGVNGGRLCLTGTGISVRQIAVWYNAGLSPEEILAEYPKAALASIHAALAYYLANRETMDAELAADEADYGSARRASGSPAGR